MEETAGMACCPRLQPQIHASEEDDAGATRRRTSPAAPLPDDDDMLREILLRLPPQPSSLPRAAAVCRHWRGIVADRRFLRHFYAHHRKPPLLGVFVRRTDGPGVVFSPILGHPDRVPPERFNLGRCSSGYDLLDCRHGLVLLENLRRTQLAVCDPVTGQRRRVAIPPEHRTHFINAAVLCAASDQGHVHGGCHSTPFKVVLMSQYKVDGPLLTRVYSSETGAWGDIILTEPPCEIYRKPAVLVGNCLYWMSMVNAILEFDLVEHSVTVRGPPVTDEIPYPNCQIIQAGDGAVGCAILSYPRLEMWRRNITDRGVATWVPWKTTELHTILRLPAPTYDGMDVEMFGYDEDDDAVFLCYGLSAYLLQLKSMQSRKLGKIYSIRNHFFPFKSFFAPAIAGRI